MRKRLRSPQRKLVPDKWEWVMQANLTEGNSNVLGGEDYGSGYH